MSWLAALKLIGDVVALLLKAAAWIEREKLRSEAERAAAEKAEERIRAQIEEARAIRARVRAELDALGPDGLREHPDSHIRD